ncbi:hypothetical protein ACGFYV_04200 [Streptomyces sp. NPDC048297]|uniref:hypothetical protein n=1 Tax=Streptomyces sp. NPDC048297 TaxID=3365531 RepID=UPI00371397D8
MVIAHSDRADRSARASSWLPDAPWISAEQRAWFKEHVSGWLGANAAMPVLPRPRPYVPSPRRAALSRDRARSVPEFFRNCLRVYEAVLSGDVLPAVERAIYGGLPAHQGLEFHRALGPAALTIPLSFRTDESMSGKLYEVQVPGSGWGEYLLLSDYYATFHGRERVGTDAAGTAEAYVGALRRTFGTDDPCLMHLVDTSSGQTGTRYFIERARAAGARYYGADPGVGAADVVHIKSHFWQALLTEFHSAQHLPRAANEPALYDRSLNWLFTTKVMTALPFWRLTAEFFTDQDRDLFPYTAVLEEDGVQLPDGRLVSREEFVAEELPGSRYFLKYADADVARGSCGQGIHVLDGVSTQSLSALDLAWQESGEGSTWIVQRAVDDTSYEVDPDLAGWTPKLSVLCSLGEYLGSLILFGKGPVVHARTSVAATVCAQTTAPDLRIDGAMA